MINLLAALEVYAPEPINIADLLGNALDDTIQKFRSEEERQ